MAWFWHLNLINLFNFYLWLMFLVGTYRRIGQYQSILGLVRAVPGRWPRLFNLVKRHGNIFLTWATILPAVLALSVTLAQTLASWLLWPAAGRPQTGLTVARLAEHGALVPVVLLLGLAMLGVDLYGTFTAGEVDREMMQRYFDQAEYWLRSWTAPAVRVFTLGYVNPRKMVAVEVRKALVECSRLINSTLWWVSIQVSVRVAYGLALWLAYAWHRG